LPAFPLPFLLLANRFFAVAAVADLRRFTADTTSATFFQCLDDDDDDNDDDDDDEYDPSMPMFASAILRTSSS
jgi:hypothetical protein